MVGSLNTQLSKKEKKKKVDCAVNKETVDLNKTIDQMNLIEIYRTFHPTIAEYTLFLSTHEIF